MLTDTQCRNAKGREKAYKLADSGGLYLHVSPAGHRSWRLKYRYGGKEKLRTLGTYPELGLRDAREQRDADKRLLKQGKDPVTEAKRVVLANRLAPTDTFELLAREWYAKQTARWKPVHAKDVIESLERDVFGDLGSLPVSAIDTAHIQATLKKVEDRGAIETAHRLRQRISAIFVYGIGEKRVAADPAAALVKILKAKPPTRRWPAETQIRKVREVLKIVEQAEITPVVKLASRFLALTAQRPGMIRWMLWSEIHDFDVEADVNADAIWIVPASKMKQEITQRHDDSFDHPVPLSPAAVDVLREAWKFSADSKYVFPGQHSIQRPMSENALSYLYLREGLRRRHVPHGWRSSFSTIMNEWVIENGGPRDPMIVDLMLAHIPAGISASELRYNRAGYIERRRKLATIWSEILLEGAKPTPDIVQGRRRRKL